MQREDLEAYWSPSEELDLVPEKEEYIMLYDDQIVAENTKPKRDWIPHLTILLVVAAFFTIIWISLTSQFDNIYIDIRELRTDVKKMDSRLDAIEKDIAIIKTKLNPVQPTSSQ